jgi:lipopolysaccharide transport system ATP-binding protein
VDEVLAVGDAEFQKQCLGKMGDVAHQGRTVLFVSHNMGAVARLCGKALVMSASKCTYWPKAHDAIARYLQSGATQFTGRADLTHAPGWDTHRKVVFTGISTHKSNGEQTASFATGEGIVVRMAYSLPQAIPAAYCQVNFIDSLGERVMTASNLHAGPPVPVGGEGVVECRLDALRLGSGDYTLDIEIGRRFPCIEYLDYVPAAATIHVDIKDYLNGHELANGQGVIAQKSQWTFVS